MLNGGRFNPSVPVVSVPLGPVSFLDSGRFGRVCCRVASWFAIGGRMRSMSCPIIIVTFGAISASRTTALLTWNRETVMNALKDDLAAV